MPQPTRPATTLCTPEPKDYSLLLVHSLQPRVEYVLPPPCPHPLATLLAAERTIVNRERSKRGYRLLPYLLSKLAAELPIGALFPALFASIVYPTTGLNPKLSRCAALRWAVQQQRMQAALGAWRCGMGPRPLPTSLLLGHTLHHTTPTAAAITEQHCARPCPCPRPHPLPAGSPASWGCWCWRASRRRGWGWQWGQLPPPPRRRWPWGPP